MEGVSGESVALNGEFPGFCACRSALGGGLVPLNRFCRRQGGFSPV